MIKKDPNYAASDKDYQEQFDFLTVIKNKFEETQQTIRDIRTTRGQSQTTEDRLGKDYPAELDSLGKTIIKQMAAIEESLYQTKAKSGQDVLNYPIRLNDKLVFDAANQHEPMAQSKEAYDDLVKFIDVEID